MTIKRNLAQSGDDMYINKWWTGLVTQRSPLFVPVSALGNQVVARHDSLLDGTNIEVSPNMTLVRRPGFPAYCSTSLGAEKPLQFFSFKNTAGTIKAMVDTESRVAYFTDSAITSVFTKGTTAQTSFSKVGDVLYMFNGTDAKRWDGTNVNDIGITTPATAPTLTFAAGVLSPLSGYKYGYCYRRSTTGEVSTMSPASANTLAQTLQNITVHGASSADGTVDKVDIFRTRDGGSLYYFLATVNNGGTWTYTDSSADIDLNDDIVAPTAHLNDPPPAGASLACFHMGRMWVAQSNNLYFGGGPQVTYGVPESCFPPANVFVLPGKITAMVSTSQGLAVWTEDDFYVVTGSDLANFNARRYQANFGVASQNCVSQDGDLLLVLTTNKQLFRFSDSLDEVGYSIRNLLAEIDPASAYLALHRSGTDEGLFVSDGSTTVYRYSLAQNCWCTAGVVEGGVSCVSSVEVATADYRLLAGRSSTAGRILNRDLLTFSDDGTVYGADATIGTLMLAPPGQVATVKSMVLETMPVGSYPTLSVLLNEISGDFTELPNPIADPVNLPASETVWARRHYLDAAQDPLTKSLIRYMLVKIEFASEDAKSELLGLAVQG
jgi:hypothetical protein